MIFNGRIVFGIPCEGGTTFDEFSALSQDDAYQSNVYGWMANLLLEVFDETTVAELEEYFESQLPLFEEEMKKKKK